MSIKTTMRNFGAALKLSFRGADWASNTGWQILTGNVWGMQGSSVDLLIPGAQRPAENVVMVFGCLSARREAVSRVPFRLSTEAGDLIESGPLHDLLARPNADMQWSDYVRRLETHLALWDVAAVAVMRPAPNAPPDELIPLHPLGLLPIVATHTGAGTASVTAWNYFDPWTGQHRRFERDHILIHRGYNPHALFAALAPIQVLSRTTNSDLAAREMNMALLKNIGEPPFYLRSDNPIQKEQAEQIQNEVDTKWSGYRNRGKPFVLWGGLEAQKLGLAPSEMEWIEGLKLLRSDYYIVFRVNPAVVGEMSGETGLSQGSSTTNQVVTWWQNFGLQELQLLADLHAPILESFAAHGRGLGARTRKLSRMQGWSCRRAAQRAKLQSPGAAMFFWPDENQIPEIAEHRLAKLEQFKTILGVGYTPDDANDFLDLGLPPHPTNIATVPMGVQPAEDLRAQPEASAPAPISTEPEAPRAVQLLDRLLQRMCLGEVRGELPTKWKSVRAKLDRLQASMEKAAAKKFTRYFMEQRDRVLARCAKLRTAEGETRSNAGDLLKELFPQHAENELLAKRMAGLQLDHIQTSWRSVNEEVGLAEKANPFTVDDPRIKTALEKRVIQNQHINATTAEDLRGILKDYVDEGWTKTQLGDRMAEYYNEHALTGRPQLAAQMQTVGLVNDGRLASAKSAGNLRKGWLHGGSEVPRASHVAAQQRYLDNPIPLDEDFDLDGVKMSAPGDADAPIEETANCSCMSIYSMAKGTDDED